MASRYGGEKWFQCNNDGRVALTFYDDEDDSYTWATFNIRDVDRSDDHEPRERRNILGYSTEIGNSITQRSPSRARERTIDESKPQYIIRYLKEQNVPLSLDHEAKIREIYLAKW